MTLSGIHAQLADFAVYCTEPGEKNRIDLLVRCDRILAAIHDLPDLADDSDYPEPPEKEYNKTRALVSAAFPDFGFYNLPETVLEDIGDCKVMVGDAIDDIADIVGDFTEVLWRLENTSVDDAIWHLRFGYTSHWGRHMRDLQFYLERVESGD